MGQYLTDEELLTTSICPNCGERVKDLHWRNVCTAIDFKKAHWTSNGWCFRDMLELPKPTLFIRFMKWISNYDKSNSMLSQGKT